MVSSSKRDKVGPKIAVADPSRLSPNGSPALDRVIQAQIGDKLRAMYGELSEQPLPDRLSAILARLGSGSERGS